MWKQSYNACPTVLYSIDIGNVSVFTVQKVGGKVILGPQTKKSGGPGPPPTPGSTPME